MPKTKTKIAWPKNDEAGFTSLKMMRDKLMGENDTSYDLITPAYNLLMWGFRCNRIHGRDKRFAVAKGEYTKAQCVYQGREPMAPEKALIKAGERQRKLLESA